MKYSWVSITKSCVNFGNFQIEFCLKKILEEHGFTQKPDFFVDGFVVNSKKIAEEVNKTDFLLVPGCTTLTVKHYPGLQSIIENIKVPIFNLGAAFFGQPDQDSIPYFKYFYQPIGVRDPESENFLKQNNIPVKLIGCPTLFSGTAEKFENRQTNKIVFIFGLKEIENQKEILKMLIQKKYDIQLLIQEKSQKKLIKEFNLNPIIYSPENLMNALKDARLMVTGRLHGALPAIACGTPVFFTQTVDDSRFSLLNYLGIESFSFKDEPLEEKLFRQIKNLEFTNSKYTFEKVKILRSAFNNYVDEVLKEISLLS